MAQNDAPAEANAAKAPIGTLASRSVCEPFRDLIRAKLDDGLTAQRIFQDLVREHGFTAQYHSVCPFVRHLDAGRPLPFQP